MIRRISGLSSAFDKFREYHKCDPASLPEFVESLAEGKDLRFSILCITAVGLSVEINGITFAPDGRIYMNVDLPEEDAEDLGEDYSDDN